MLTTINNRFLGSLDFSKAFGHVRPLSAGAAMVHTGCPAALVRGILSVWRQRRLLCWGSSAHHKFIGVTESMPQGDPFAVLALGLLLRIPVLKLQARFPRLLQVIYVDDRTCVVTRLLSVLRCGTAGSAKARTLVFVKITVKPSSSTERRKGGRP